jgi:hypothetical protein
MLASFIYRTVLISVSTLTSVTAMAEDKASWSIRFEEKVSVRSAHTGCYGTSSYGYSLPSLRQLREYFPGVMQQIGADALIFISDKGAAGEYQAFDTAKTEVIAIPIESAADYLGIAACICRAEYTFSQDMQGHPNCAPSQSLPALGKTFLADRYEVIEEPGSQETWTDPVTNWTWRISATASNWHHAAGKCHATETFPDYPTIGHAAHRLWESALGDKLKSIEATRVWSSNEFDEFSAMVAHLPRGDASATGKQWLYPVLCVTQISNDQ